MGKERFKGGSYDEELQNLGKQWGISPSILYMHPHHAVYVKKPAVLGRMEDSCERE